MLVAIYNIRARRAPCMIESNESNYVQLQGEKLSCVHCMARMMTQIHTTQNEISSVSIRARRAAG